MIHILPLSFHWKYHEAFFIIMVNMQTHTGAASPPAQTATVDPSCPVISWCLRKRWQRAHAWTPALHPGLSPLSGSRSKSLSWTFTCATTWSSSAQVHGSSGGHGLRVLSRMDNHTLHCALPSSVPLRQLRPFLPDRKLPQDQEFMVISAHRPQVFLRQWSSGPQHSQDLSFSTQLECKLLEYRNLTHLQLLQPTLLQVASLLVWPLQILSVSQAAG